VVKIAQVKEWLSPSAINAYLGCPRKFYCRYVLKLPTKPSIHLIRGTIVHEALELFFKNKVYTQAGEDYADVRKAALALFETTWKKHEEELLTLNLDSQDLDFFYEDSRKMILNWLHAFLKDTSKGTNPRTEQKLFSRKHKVWGIIDIIKNNMEIPHVIDYKTSKSMDMSEDYKLQLAVYSLLYLENMGTMDHRVGIHFLKFENGLKLFKPTHKAIQYALDKIDIVRKGTTTTDINDYPCTCGGWCKKDFIFENG
jgi:CRISPR/Cas system-associated exonuclease Cas4 (RecB family)